MAKQQGSSYNSPHDSTPTKYILYLNSLSHPPTYWRGEGAKYRLGPELEISGYSCEDHFMELDLYLHCDQSLAAILSTDLTDDILCDIGCPVMHRGVRYNCRIFCLNRKIVLIRPKIYLADDGNYREKRFFSSWDVDKIGKGLEKHLLSDLLQRVTGQREVAIGVGIIATNETMVSM